MTPTRGRTLTVIGALAGAGLVLVGLGRPWLTASVWTVTGSTTVRATGRTLVPAVAAVALVAAAAAAVVLFLGPRARRAIGGLLVLTGLAAAGLLAGLILDPGAALAPVIAESTSVVGSPQAPTARTNPPASRPRLSGWIAVSAVGAALVLGAGSAVLLGGSSWPEVRSGTATGNGSGSGSHPGNDTDLGDRRATWERLDRGEDPTV